MCCIFTCCGWMIDLVQRLWTFTMSCCISSAVCCAFVTASMSGIALGYNYSLAEYIDLKETNVSVYIKRGVFDDEVSDDMDWRRSGHKPIAGFIGENNLKTGAPGDDESTPLRSGRRLEDSIFESDDQNKFEGSLMKLTAKPIHPSTVATKGASSDVEMSAIIAKYPEGSLDQLKAIQSLINMRKSGTVRETTTKEAPKTTYGYDARYLPFAPNFMDPMGSGRRRMQVVPGSTPYQYSLRQAVPGPDINEPAKWMLPKMPPEELDKGVYEDYDRRPTYPSPVTPKRTPVRPSRSTTPVKARPSPTKSTKAAPNILEPIMPRPIDRDLEEFKEKLMLNNYEGPGIKGDEFMRMPKNQNKPEGDYYDEDIKGLPVRRRRHINVPKIKEPANNNIKSTILFNPDRRKDKYDSNVNIDKHSKSISNNVDTHVISNDAANAMTSKSSANTLHGTHANDLVKTIVILTKSSSINVHRSITSNDKISEPSNNSLLYMHSNDSVAPKEILTKLSSNGSLNVLSKFKCDYAQQNRGNNHKSGRVSKFLVIYNPDSRNSKKIDSSAEKNAQQIVEEITRVKESAIRDISKEMLLLSTKQFILELLRPTTA